MEQAVALRPRDAGYRLLLADIYLKSGRFDSARDHLCRRARARSCQRPRRLSVALIQIAQGNPRAAVGRLDELAGRAPAADVGLAYALAGAADRADRIARAGRPRPRRDAAHPPESRLGLCDGRRLAPRPRDRRAGLSPAEVARADAAMGGASPGPAPAPTQVAAPARRQPGRGSRPAGPPRAGARAGPTPSPRPRRAPVAERPAPVARPRRRCRAAAPVQVAEAAPAEAPAFWVADRAILSGRRAEPRRVEAAEAPSRPRADARGPASSLCRGRRAAWSRPSRALIRAAARRPRAPPPRLPAAPAPRSRPRRLGAGRRPARRLHQRANAERAWLAGLAPLRPRRPRAADHDDRHRRPHPPPRLGRRLRHARRRPAPLRLDPGQGGVCFVRASAGDASIRWAARYANPRQRNV